MSTITKQWLQQKIADMEATRDEIPFGLDEDDRNTLAALRIALASLEAEPYGYVHKAAYEQAGSCGLSSDHEAYRDSSTHVDVYAAPPASVTVPDELTREEYKRRFMEDDSFNDTFRGGWNACRGAMLQAGNSPVIPDGWVLVPVEPTPDMREAYHQAQEEYEETDGLWSPDHQWKAMLAAAPQQELK